MRMCSNKNITQPVCAKWSKNVNLRERCLFLVLCGAVCLPGLAVQYESTFLPVMTLRRFAVMPSRNNVTWKLIWPSNHSSKGAQPRSKPLQLALQRDAAGRRGSALSLKILTFIYTFSLKRGGKFGRVYKQRGVTRLDPWDWSSYRNESNTTLPSRRTVSDFNKCQRCSCLCVIMLMSNICLARAGEQHRHWVTPV